MREFPNYLMSVTNRIPDKSKQDNATVSVLSSLKKTSHEMAEKKRQSRQNKELEQLEQQQRTPFKPKVLPPAWQKKTLEKFDYSGIKEALYCPDEELLLFAEVLDDEFDVTYQEVKGVKSVKRGLNQSMNGILEKEVIPNRYFNKSK